MSLRGTIEILVHLQHFRNIDLFHQGVYQLRVTIYQKQVQAIRQAQPYMILEESYKKEPRKQLIFNNLMSKTTQENFVQGSRLQDVEFWSKAFVIKYCDEQIELNDGCVFRMEVDAFPTLRAEEVYFQVDLMYTELSTLTQEDYKPERLKGFMKPVAKFESKVNNLFGGIHEFVPIQFDELHFCVIRATVHSVLIDFKFRQTQVVDEQNEVQPGETFDQFLKRITKIWSKVQRDLVNDFYSGYVKSLNRTHEQFLRYQQNVVTNCLKDPMLMQKFKNVNHAAYFPSFLKRDMLLQSQKEVSENYSTDQEEQKNASLQQAMEIRITDYFNLDDIREQLELSNCIILEINQLSSYLFSVWYMFLEMFDYAQKELTNNLEKEYIIKIKDRWGESVFQNSISVQDLAQQTEHRIGRKHKEVAQQIRNNQYYQLLEPLCIEDLNLFPQAKIHPILFKEVFQKKDAQTQLSPLKGVHLMVFVHGYQGNSFDMRLWKNILAVKYPDHILLSMTSNEDNTEQDIMFMGQKLSEEVKKWIKEWCPKDQFAKLSFVGHSLGGLIIRAALPHLDKYRDKMHTILTLATPHLGYMLSSSKVVDTGLWVIKKWKKCICLNQLTLADSGTYEGCCLYRLSQQQGLGWFRNVILVSSYQDSYVPFESARIQRTSKVSPDSDKGKAYNRMIDNILAQLQTDRIERLDVNYEIVGKNLDNMIGRAAHIAFLENQALIRLIIYSFESLFE